MLDIHRWLGIMRLVMEIKTIEELDKAISDGPFTQLGMYPKYFITNDGGVLSFKSVVDNIELIKDAIKDNDRFGWRVCELGVVAVLRPQRSANRVGLRAHRGERLKVKIKKFFGSLSRGGLFCVYIRVLR